MLSVEVIKRAYFNPSYNSELNLTKPQVKLNLLLLQTLKQHPVRLI